jgi:hypothetical protein
VTALPLGAFPRDRELYIAHGIDSLLDRRTRGAPHSLREPRRLFDSGLASRDSDVGARCPRLRARHRRWRSRLPVLQLGDEPVNRRPRAIWPPRKPVRRTLRRQMTRQRPRRERALYRRHAYQRRARRPTRGNGPPHAQQPAQGLGHGPNRPHDAAHHGRARSDASICCARLPRPTEYPRLRQAVLRFLTPTNGQPRSFQAASTQSRLLRATIDTALDQHGGCGHRVWSARARRRYCAERSSRPPHSLSWGSPTPAGSRTVEDPSASVTKWQCG